MGTVTTAAKIKRVRALIEASQARATRAGALAESYDSRAAHADDLHRGALGRMAEVHRQTQVRHLAVIDLHTGYLARLWLAHAQAGNEHSLTLRRPAADTGVPAAVRSQFVDVLAERLGTDHIGLALSVDGNWVAKTAASALVDAAQDLELTLGEGPMHDVTGDGAVHIDEAETICRRWQSYGPDVISWGARSLQAAPIRSADEQMGALLMVNQRSAATETLDEVADEVGLSLLIASVPMDAHDASSGHPLLTEATSWDGIHHAAGVISRTKQCGLDDATALLRARAYADGIPILQLAADIVSGTAHLD